MLWNVYRRSFFFQTVSSKRSKKGALQCWEKSRFMTITKTFQGEWAEQSVWKFDKFAAFQIFRQINFGRFCSLKSWTLIWWNVFISFFFSFFSQNFSKIEVLTFQNCQKCWFLTQHLLELISRKISLQKNQKIFHSVLNHLWCCFSTHWSHVHPKIVCFLENVVLASFEKQTNFRLHEWRVYIKQLLACKRKLHPVISLGFKNQIKFSLLWAQCAVYTVMFVIWELLKLWTNDTFPRWWGYCFRMQFETLF